MTTNRPKGASDMFSDAHALHVVDSSRAKDGVWLVKVPKYLAELWQKSGPDGVVGKVVIAAGKSSEGKKPVSQVTLETDQDLLSQAGEPHSLIPKEHQFLIQSSSFPTATSSTSSSRSPQLSPRRPGVMSGQELIILAEDDLAMTTTSSTTPVTSSTLSSSSITPGSTSTVTSQPSSPFSNLPYARYSRRLSLFGRVNSRAECRPPPTARYMMLKAQQLKAKNRPKNEVRLLFEPVRTYKPVSNHASNIEYEAKKRAEGKNLRREKEDVMQDLFKAFERHQYYAIRDLVLLTKQPVSYLTEILKEIAIFNPRAPHKNMWELKPEYRHYTPEGGSESTMPVPSESK